MSVTPEQLAKSGTEHGEQTALFAQCALHVKRYPELKWFHAIGNGGSRGDSEKSRRIRGGAMKAEGVKAGVLDTLLPVKRGIWSGLYIEMKKPSQKPVKARSKGGMSDEQLEFKAFAEAQGFACMTAYSWLEAWEALTKYLTWQN